MHQRVKLSFYAYYRSAAALPAQWVSCKCTTWVRTTTAQPQLFSLLAHCRARCVGRKSTSIWFSRITNSWRARQKMQLRERQQENERKGERESDTFWVSHQSKGRWHKNRLQNCCGRQTFVGATWRMRDVCLTRSTPRWHAGTFIITLVTF